MSDNIEIIMDIDSLEIFDVIDLNENENIVDFVSEGNSEEKVSPYDDLDKIWLGNGYYKPSSLLWEVIKDNVIHELKLRIKFGTCPYSRRARDGIWGSQLTYDETLQTTMQFAPELLASI